MHIYTHIATGLLLGKVLFPQSPVLQAATVAGSTLPDIPVIMFGIKKVLQKKDNEPADLGTNLAHHILHSFVVWFCLVLLSIGLLRLMGHSAMNIPPELWPYLQIFFFPPPLSFGGMLHSIVDIISHKDIKGRQGRFEITQTKTYAWPFGWYLGDFRFFDYRRWLMSRSDRSWLNLVTIQEIFITLICIGLYFIL